MSKAKVSRYFIPTNGTQEDRIEEMLKQLELSGMIPCLASISQGCFENHSTYYEFLERLLTVEIELREENRIQKWLQQARFPWKKSLEDFNYSFQPTSMENRLEINEAASCRFIEKYQNIVFIGQPGVGKTHITIGLGLKAISLGYEVKFLSLRQLIDLVKKQSSPESLRRLLDAYLRPKLLILDEMDLHKVEENVSDFIFELLYNRYKKGATIFTSNRKITEWKNLFGGETRAGAIIDRIVEDCKILWMTGKSYRAERNIYPILKPS